MEYICEPQNERERSLILSSFSREEERREKEIEDNRFLHIYIYYNWIPG